MEMIKTDSFELATSTAGDPRSERMMLCLPGRLDTKDYTHMQRHMSYFAGKGFFTLSFDPPGTWESGGDISLYTTENYLIAINEIIAYFGNKPTVTIGHSRGGTMALLSGIHNEHVTHMVAIMSHWGPSIRPDIKTDVYVTTRDLPPGTEHNEERKAFELPMSYFDETTDYGGLDTCTKPKLFIAGRHDTLATPKIVQDMYAIAAEPKQYLELDSGHDYRLHPHIIDEVNVKVQDFLKI